MFVSQGVPAARTMPLPLSTTGEARERTDFENSLGFSNERPATLRASQWVAVSAPSPLQTVGVDGLQCILRFMHPTEIAALLMPVSRNMQSLILKLYPLIREISKSPQILEYSRLAACIRTTDQTIAQLTQADNTPPQESVGTFKRMQKAFTSRGKEKERAAEAAAARTAQRNSQIREKVRLTSALEDNAESVAFHIARERLKRTQPDPPVLRSDSSRLHQAINAGDSELVRTVVPVYLNLPAQLMSQRGKIAWLGNAKGVCTLVHFGGYPCSDPMDTPELRQYDAIHAYVASIVCSELLLRDQKSQLVVRLELPDIDPVDSVRHAMDSGNPAVAASILLGIHESGADDELRQWLLKIASASWKEGGLDQCVAFVSESLGRVSTRAPTWIGPVVARLDSMRAVRCPPA
jgi:hypothetical protein